MGTQKSDPYESGSEAERHEREVADVSEQLADAIAERKPTEELVTRLRALIGPEMATKRYFVLESLLTDRIGDFLENANEGSTGDGHDDRE